MNFYEQEIRNKAIEEFAKKIKHICKERPVGVDSKSKELVYVPIGDNVWHGLLDDLVAQMKIELPLEV